jgi:hypothetical protein
MRHLMIVALALWTSTVLAQEIYQLETTNLLARLSYASTLAPNHSIRKICISVSQDGSYQMFSWIDDAKGPRGSQGRMSKDQLQELKALLSAPAFRSLSGNHAGMIRDHAETFMAEISPVEFPAAFQPEGTTPSGPLRGKAIIPRWLQWLNGDGENPFPAPITNVIDWMRTFKPRNARALDYPDRSNVCPAVGFSLIQPSVATNQRP